MSREEAGFAKGLDDAQALHIVCERCRHHHYHSDPFEIKSGPQAVDYFPRFRRELHGFGIINLSEAVEHWVSELINNGEKEKETKDS